MTLRGKYLHSGCALVVVGLALLPSVSLPDPEPVFRAMGLRQSEAATVMVSTATAGTELVTSVGDPILDTAEYTRVENGDWDRAAEIRFADDFEVLRHGPPAMGRKMRVEKG